MNSNFAKWGLVQLLTIMMLVVAGSAFAAGEALMHNSDNLGTTKYGAWGVAGGTYGQFTCATCHNKTTENVKRVAGTLTAPLGNWSSSKATTVSVVFNNMTAFGTDAAAHTTSTQVCQVCHSKTTVHRYNKPVGQADSNHKGANQTDCTSCHSHADAFKGKGCTACHGSYATSGNPIITGKHTAHIANAVYGCADCHAKSVIDDATIKGAPTAHQNSTWGDYSGARAGGSYAAGNCSNVYCHTDGKGGVPAVAVNWGTGPALDCKGCHGGGTSQAGEPVYVSGNSHTKHVGTVGANATCQNCHGGTMGGVALNASGKHTDKSIDVAQGNGKTFTFNAGTCSNISCHGGVGTTANWGATLDCNGCHATTGLTTGSHNKHLNASIATSLTCDKCHANTATSNSALVAEPNAHTNYATDVVFADGGGSNCATVYCHSDGSKASGYTSKTAAPTWGGSSVACTTCHGGGRGGAQFSSISTGRHLKHINSTYAYNYGCAVCHATTVSGNTTISSAGNHVNKQINVSFSGAATTGGASASYATTGHAPGQPGTINDSCQNIYCHSNAQIQPGHANPQFRNLTGVKRWGQTGTVGCTGCHGGSTTLGQWALSGKHLAHTASAIAIICHQCHLSGGTNINDNRINHVNGLVNYSSQWTGRATLADGKCNNVYCHSNGKGVFVNMTNANWFSTRTLDCKGCHGGTSSQAGEPSYANGGINNVLANNHPQHVGTAGANATCQNCHSNTVTGVLLNATTHSAILAGTSRTIPYHADQSINDTNEGVYSGNGKTFSYTAATKTCSNISCHSGNGLVAGVAAAQWGDNFGCQSCHGGNAAAANKITSGQHAKHTNNAGIIGVDFGCVACHAQTVTNDTTLASVNVHMNAVANYSGARAGKNKAACTAAYCHSNGKGDAGTTVSWTTGPALDCKGCHGGASSQAGEPVYVSTAPGTLKTNTHPKHVGTTGSDTTCQNCHGSTMNVALLSNSGNHLNGSINVIQGSDISKSFTYSNNSSKTCSNIDCHSGNGMFTSNPIQWGATMPIDCTGCHANDVTAAALSGAHNAHINNALAGGNFRCKDCHAPTITNSDNRTIANANKHGNTIINYSGAKAGKNKNCSNIYCHSNGKGVFAAIPAWLGGSANCQSCHATGALLVGHSKHIAKGATCAQCHNATTSDSATITGSSHIDGTVNLQQGGTPFKGKAVSFAPSGTTCNNISCHSPYVSSTASATWGVAATCETCHPKAGLSGAHLIHMGALNLTSSSVFYNMTANHTPAVAQVSETDRKHGFGCGECHPLDKDTFHLNGAIDVDMNRVNVAGVGSLRFLNASSAAYHMDDADINKRDKCSNIYCHSNASRIGKESNVKANTSLAWTETYAGLGVDRCASCHGNQPTTGAHAAHSVGVHTFNEVTLENGGAGIVLDGNIFNGVSGKVPITNKPNTAHGNPNNSTTISCYICHYATVTSKANDKNYKCSPCHVTGSYNASPKGLAAISNLKNHVNGLREIEFPAVQVLSKAQIRPKGPNKTNSTFDFYSGTWTRTSYKNMSTLSFDKAKVALNTAVMWHYSSAKESNCSNISCHNGKFVKWNLSNFHDPNKCMDCHNAL